MGRARPLQLRGASSITGIYLTFFFEGSQEEVIYRGSYEPLQGVEVSAAYDSVLRISFDVKGGLLIRQMHHWAALIFVGAVSLHMARVFFTGAFRRPRELNWVVGVLLLILALAAGFTGYSLPDDLLSGTGLRIIHAVILAIPFIGERATYLLFGGEWPGTDIIGRLYPVHILIIPALIVAALGPPPGTRVAAEAHPVPRARAHRAQRRRRAGLAVVRHEVDRVAVRRRRRVRRRWARCSTSTRSGSTGPTTRRRRRRTRSPTGTSASSRARCGCSRRGRPGLFGFVINNVVYSGVDHPGPDLHVARSPCRGSSAGSPATTPSTTCSIAHATRPIRTATGVACLTVVALLFLGGSQDVIAGTFDISIGHVTAILQISLLVAPPIAWIVTWRLCRTLAGRPAPERTERAGVVVRDQQRRLPRRSRGRARDRPATRPLA